MSEPPPQIKPKMSLRTGALVLRGAVAFMGNRPRRAAAPPAQTQTAQSTRVSRRRTARATAMERAKLSPKLAEAIRKKTHFTKPEIEGLYQIYRKLVALSNPGRIATMSAAMSGAIIAKPAPKVEGIDQNVFRDILHNTFELVTEEVVLERTFGAWTRGSEGALRFDAWACGLSVLVRGTPSEKAAHCFAVYDLNSDGYITKDEMFTLLRNCLLKQPGDEDPDEGVRDLVELVLKKLDVDKDGRVSFDDYQQSVAKEPLLMEAFGQCLPANAECITFLETLQP